MLLIDALKKQLAEEVGEDELNPKQINMLKQKLGLMAPQLNKDELDFRHIMYNKQGVSSTRQERVQIIKQRQKIKEEEEELRKERRKNGYRNVRNFRRPTKSPNS